MCPINLQADIFLAKNPIYAHIIKNNPSIDRIYALKLSDSIHVAAKKYHINPYKLSGIIAYESMYRLDAVNHKTLDYGLTQINHKTIKRYNLSKDKIMTDYDYAIHSGAMVLSYFKKRFAKTEADWWCRYNVGTGKKEKLQQKCDKYIKLVSKYI